LHMLRYLLLMTMVLSADAAMAIEKPSYDVVWESEAFEIRRYAPAILAQTAVQGSFKQVGNDAFRKLGGYIFGQNVTEEKIAMTAPVTQTQRENGEYLVSFYMPSEHSLDTLPDPKDQAVKMIEMPETYFAARKYRGGWSEVKYNRHVDTLSEALKALSEWQVIGEPVWARYNPPMMPSFLRTNEVLIPVKPNLP